MAVDSETSNQVIVVTGPSSGGGDREPDVKAIKVPVPTSTNHHNNNNSNSSTNSSSTDSVNSGITVPGAHSIDAILGLRAAANKKGENTHHLSHQLQQHLQRLRNNNNNNNNSVTSGDKHSFFGVVDSTSAHCFKEEVDLDRLRRVDALDHFHNNFSANSNNNMNLAEYVNTGRTEDEMRKEAQQAHHTLIHHHKMKQLHSPDLSGGKKSRF